MEKRRCDFCERLAEYSGKTLFGSWADMCEIHFKIYGAGLGIGLGQPIPINKKTIN